MFSLAESIPFNFSSLLTRPIYSIFFYD